MSAPGTLPPGSFTSSEVFERPVKMADGSVHSLHFREASAMHWRRYRIAAHDLRTVTDDDAETERHERAFERATAVLISSSLLNPDGSQALTIEQAHQLKFEVQAAMVNAMQSAGPEKDQPGNG